MAEGKPGSSAVRSGLLSLLIVGELLFLARVWHREATHERLADHSCESMRSGITRMMSVALGGRVLPIGLTETADGALTASEAERTVVRYLTMSDLTRENPMVPGRPIAEHVQGLNFVPGPAMHCTVFVLTDPDPKSGRVLVRQFQDGKVFEEHVEPIDPANVVLPPLLSPAA